MPELEAELLAVRPVLSPPWPWAAWAVDALCAAAHVWCTGRGHTFGALWAWPHHSRQHLLTPVVGLNFKGREGTLDSIPLTLSQRQLAVFQAAPAVPGAGTFPQQGGVIAAGPPWKTNTPLVPATQHGTGIPQQAETWLACLLSAQPQRHGSAQHKYLRGW